MAELCPAEAVESAQVEETDEPIENEKIRSIKEDDEVE